MPRDRFPTFLELMFLSILLNGEKFGRAIKKEFEARTGESMSYGTLYVTLDRMERAGLIESRAGKPNEELGGAQRRHFKLRASGERVLFEAQASLGGAAHA